MRIAKESPKPKPKKYSVKPPAEIETITDVIQWPGSALAEIQHLRRVVRALDQTLSELDSQLPDGHGGAFTKRFAANILRGILGTVNSQERGQTP